MHKNIQQHLRVAHESEKLHLLKFSNLLSFETSQTSLP